MTITAHQPSFSGLDAAAEAARQQIFDAGLFDRYLRLFVPAVRKHPERYIGRVLLEGRRSWFDAKEAQPMRAIIGSLLQGAAGAAGEGAIATGCAVRPFGGDKTRVVRVDVDRGDAQAIVRALAARYGSEALLVTRSRRRGGYHIMMRLRRPLTVKKAHQRLRHLLGAIVRDEEKVEAFPAPNRGLRMPFGLHGCEAADDHDCIRITKTYHPWQLLDRAQGLRPVKLPKAPLRKKLRACISDREKCRTFDAADRFVRQGLGAGERDKGEREIIVALHGRGVPQREAVSRMRRLIYSGLIDRTQYVRESNGDVQRARARRAADMERRVGDYYTKYLQKLPRPVNLSAHDAVELAEFAYKRSLVTGIPGRDLAVFLYRVMRVFKAAALAGVAVLQWHHDHWRRCASHSRYGYAKLREAAGIFSTDGSYLAQNRAWRPDDAHAKRWRCAWLFDAQVPRQPLHNGRKLLTRVVTAAIGVARRKVARGYRALLLAFQPEKPPKPTGRPQRKRSPLSGVDQLPFPLAVVGISTNPPSGLGYVELPGGGLGVRVSVVTSKPAEPTAGRKPPRCQPSCGVPSVPTPGQPSFPTAEAVREASPQQLNDWLAARLGAECEDRILREKARRAKLRRGACFRPPQPQDKNS